MKKLNTLLLISALLAGAASAHAASHGGARMTGDATKDSVTKDSVTKDSVTKASADLADGEVRKIDVENKKITLKHGVIKNLDMPGMTMVFQVKDAVLLNKVKVGDKVRFSAEQSGGAIVVTAIEASK